MHTLLKILAGDLAVLRLFLRLRPRAPQPVVSTADHGLRITLDVTALREAQERLRQASATLPRPETFLSLSESERRHIEAMTAPLMGVTYGIYRPSMYGPQNDHFTLPTMQ